MLIKPVIFYKPGKKSTAIIDCNLIAINAVNCNDCSQMFEFIGNHFVVISINMNDDIS